MARAWGRRAFRVGLIIGAALAAARLGPKLWKARAERKDESARRAIEAMWPPVSSALKGPARILAPLAHRVGAGAHDGASGDDGSRAN